jgi:hypothetical protein
VPPLPGKKESLESLADGKEAHPVFPGFDFY